MSSNFHVNVHFFSSLTSVLCLSGNIIAHKKFGNPGIEGLKIQLYYMKALHQIEKVIDANNLVELESCRLLG